MIITHKHLPRRTFLKGMGTTIALPMLDAMTPALASRFEAGFRANNNTPVRLAFVYVPNGIVMQDWKPKEVGKDFELTRILKPLEAFREDFCVLSGLDDRNGNALGDGPGDHARAGASFLTGVHCKKTAGADIQNGISADQVAAQKLASETRLPSLELGCEDSRTVGNCDSGYSCAYTNSISWRGPTTPMPPEVNPRQAFERLFGTADLSLDPETRARRAQYRNSILDLVRERTEKLVGTLGSADRRKIDEYLSAIREIEKRIESAEKDNRAVLPTIEKPAGIPLDFREYVKLMFDLQVVAFQANITRVSTLMIGREGSMRVYPEIGIPDPHHPLTHHRNNQEWIEKVTQINCLHTELFAYFLGKLKSTKDGEGTLLDRSMIVYGSGLSDGNRHTHENLPVLLAGRGDSSVQNVQVKLKPGGHIVFSKGTPMTNLYLTLLDRMGVHPEKIGDSTGKVEHLTELFRTQQTNKSIGV
ncbi:MAG: DUF1552 domain-containing protein [Acidobacteria bacterium]|nr:DUF1552 domain-containing protein [Acidobacteriota bacterium]